MFFFLLQIEYSEQLLSWILNQVQDDSLFVQDARSIIPLLSWALNQVQNDSLFVQDARVPSFRA